MRPFIPILVLAAVACGESEPAKTPAAAAPARTPAQARADSVTRDSVRLDSVKRADSTAKATKAKRDQRLHDSAFGPSFSIDEKTGKITPIKKP